MITHPQDLHTGTPVWADYTQPRITTQTLNGNARTDILVIGIGISGAMIAHALTGHGLSVMMVDRRKPLSGSTSASTALLQYEIDTPLIHLIDKIGLEKATAAWRRSKLGVESLACQIRELNIKCDFERLETLYLAGNLLNAKELAQECIARNAVGLHNEFLSGAEVRELYGVKATSAIHSWDNLIVNPVQLAAGFLKAAMVKGAELFTPVTVGDLHHTKQGVQLNTDEGYIIQAKHVVFATGYEIPNFIHKRKHKITSTWAISTKPLGKRLMQAMPIMWEASDPYLYLRPTPDGRIICGGEDAEFSDADKRDALLPQKAKAIERKLRARLPDLDFEIEHSWAGSFGTSTTGLPSIGRVPGMQNVYCTMAYGGNGITFSAIAAEIIVSQILGQHDPDEKLFGF